MTPQIILLTAKQVAAALGVHPTTIGRWVKEARFPAPAKIGGLTRWRADDVNRYVNKQFEKAQGKVKSE